MFRWSSLALLVIVYSVCLQPYAVAETHSIGLSLLSQIPSCLNCGGLCKQGYVEVPTKEHVKVIEETFAPREARLKHTLWHMMRGRTGDDAEKLAKTYPGWKNPHKGCPMPKKDTDKNSFGEDFFFMHRMMINDLNSALNKKGLKCISGWKEIPRASDKQWPISKEGAGTTPELEQMQHWLKKFRDKDYLKGISLGQFGFVVERTIHGFMHQRWADEQTGKFRDRPSGPVVSGIFPKNWPFDDPKFNDLGDFYSSAVNPIFWKLHGLIDELIEGWLEANNYSQIATDCAGSDKKLIAGCFQWNGTWVGGKIDPKALRAGPPLPSRESLAIENEVEEPNDASKERRAVYDDPTAWVRENSCRPPPPPPSGLEIDPR